MNSNSSTVQCTQTCQNQEGVLTIAPLTRLIIRIVQFQCRLKIFRNNKALRQYSEWEMHKLIIKIRNYSCKEGMSDLKRKGRKKE